MPTFVKAHRRKGRAVRGHSRAVKVASYYTPSNGRNKSSLIVGQQRAMKYLKSLSGTRWYFRRDNTLKDISEIRQVLARKVLKGKRVSAYK